MTLWKLPPPAKVYEAFTAVADLRVRIAGSAAFGGAGDGISGSAAVTSSGGDKTYTVEWSSVSGAAATSAAAEAVTSNDSASYWQGYLGYPIVAVLIARRRVHADETAVRALAGVPWHELNARFKRDYDAAVASVLDELAERGEDRERVVREVDAVMGQLAALRLERRGRGRRPPGRG